MSNHFLTIHFCMHSLSDPHENYCIIDPIWGMCFPGGANGKKKSACQYRRHKRHRFDPWVGKIPWSWKWQPTPVFLPGKSHVQRSLVDYNPWGCKRVRHDWAQGRLSVATCHLSPKWDTRKRTSVFGLCSSVSLLSPFTQHLIFVLISLYFKTKEDFRCNRTSQEP